MMLFRLLRCTRGAAAVEFAIVSVVFVTVCIAVVDFGRTLYVKNQLSFLADIAARQILINPTVPSATLETDLRNEFVAGDPASLAIAITNETVGSNDFRRIAISFPVTLFIPYLASQNITLSVNRRVPT